MYENDILNCFEKSNEFFNTDINELEFHIINILNQIYDNINYKIIKKEINEIFNKEKKKFFNSNNNLKKIDVNKIIIRNENYLLDIDKNIYFLEFSKEKIFGKIKNYGEFNEIVINEENQKWYIDRLLKKLKNISDSYPQRTQVWYEARERMITASDISAALGHKCFKTKSQLYREKVNNNREFFGNEYTEWGVKYEDPICMIYEKIKQKTVIEYGLIPHPDINFIGASPDGITTDGVMLEIKCPKKRPLRKDYVPEYYKTQIQTQLEVCGLEECDFFECKIEEYADKDEYINDKKEYIGRGYLIHAVEGDKNKYYYCPLNTTIEEKDLWKKKTLKEKKLKENNIKDIWWKCIDSNCVKVLRDREWFIKSMPILKEFWDNVLKYRKEGLPDKLKIKKRKPKSILDNLDDSD